MTPRTRIKICGVKNVETALAAADAGADFLGLMMVQASPRWITMDQAWAIARELPPEVVPVAVFADAAQSEMLAWPGGWVQLHGNESTDSAPLPRRIIKAMRFDRLQIRHWDANNAIEAILIDGPLGGSGAPFDHAALAAMRSTIRTPLIIAGGLTPENVGEAIRTIRPWGVDVSSGVETSRGVKDATLIRRFCDAVRQADHS
jgi:phosphoribosylanthranilate isomerase